MELNRGYAGAQIFGYVVLPIWPTDYNLPRIPAAQVHDFNHRVRLTYEPWTLATMVGQYIVMESLTESFAAELYGPEYIGPWMGCLTNEETACSRSILSQALDVSGFEKIRASTFGDETAKQWGSPSLGLPHRAGYTIGYRWFKLICGAPFKPPQRPYLSHLEILSRHQAFSLNHAYVARALPNVPARFSRGKKRVKKKSGTEGVNSAIEGQSMLACRLRQTSGEEKSRGRIRDQRVELAGKRAERNRTGTDGSLIISKTIRVTGRQGQRRFLC
jgi:hypothetical protein